MPSNTSHVSTPKAAEKVFSSNTIVVGPGATKLMGVGAYSINMKQPAFTHKAVPGIGAKLELKLDRNDIPGSQRYILFYTLRNTSDRPCEVTISRDL